MNLTIRDTATPATITTDADRWDAADALRAAFPGAPAEVLDVVERAAVAIEGGARPTHEDCAYLAIEVEPA